MSSTSRNRAYQQLPTSATSQIKPSSVININGNPIAAAFEAQLQHTGSQLKQIQHKQNHLESQFVERIDQIFPRCPPSASAESTSTISTKTGSSDDGKAVKNNTSKKRAGTGKKKTGSKKTLAKKTISAEEDCTTSTISPTVEVVNNIIDLEPSNTSNCDDVNRQNFLHHQQMIARSAQIMLNPTTTPVTHAYINNDNHPSSTVILSQSTRAQSIPSESNAPLHHHQQQLLLEQRQELQQRNRSSSIQNNVTYVDAYVDNNTVFLNQSNQIVKSSSIAVEDSPPHLPNLDANSSPHLAISNTVQSSGSSIISGSSNRSCQGTSSSLSCGTGSSIGQLDSVSDMSGSFAPSAAATATPPSITSYSCSSNSAMMMSPGSSTASSSEHSASVGMGGVGRGPAPAPSNTGYNNANTSTNSTLGSTMSMIENSIQNDQQQQQQQQQQPEQTINVGRIRKNLKDYSTSGIDNRLPTATPIAVNATVADPSVLKDTKIEIAGKFATSFHCYDLRPDLRSNPIPNNQCQILR